LVDVTPIQVAAASEVIQFVNEVTVMTARIQMHKELAGRDAEHQRACGEYVPLLESLAERGSG
jgi:hypothetical protein